MAFCRRCGDIVSGPRCVKCGGLPVAPVIEWNKQSAQGANKDRWSQTYVAKASAPSALPIRVVPQHSSPPPPPRSFQGVAALASRVSEHIASATNSTSRPSSPLKHSNLSEDVILSAPDVIASPYSSELSKVYGSVLQPKESLESFHCHICSEQFTPDATIYPHPTDPTGERYLCRSCFSQNGGSRGNCVQCTRPVLLLKSEGGFVEKAGQVWHKKCFICSGCGKNIGDNPTVDLLGRPSCAECFDTCLDRRDSPGKFKTPTAKVDIDNLDQFNPTLTSTASRARKGSSTIEELEQVLGIRRSQSTPDTNHDRTLSPDVASAPLPGTSHICPSPSPSPPVLDDSPNRPTSTSELDPVSPPRLISTPSRPASKIPTKVTPEAIEAVKRRFLKPTGSLYENNVQVQATSIRDRRFAGDPLQTPTKSSVRYSDFRLLRHKGSASSIRTDRDSMLSLSSAVSMPSLTSDLSDTATISSGPSSPPSLNGEQEESASSLSSSPPSSLSGRSTNSSSLNTRNHDLNSEAFNIYTKPAISNTVHAQPRSDARCAKCSLSLFDVAHGGRYVSVPEPSSTGSLPRTYHADCFRCRICNGLFEEKESGRAVFVRGVRGACHLDCAPADRATVSKSVASPTLSARQLPEVHPQATRELWQSTSSPSTASPSTRLSSRYSAPLQFATSVSNPVPRFGTSTSCPGCLQSVSPMERGVVPGPQGQRWHSSCLVCGGKQAKGRGGRRVNGQPGCGKQLDSSAKRGTDEGGIWCRDCLLLLPYELRAPQASPTRLGSSHLKSKEYELTTGPEQPDRVVPQHTGGTTIARQFTWLSGGTNGGADASPARHVTGARLSPTKQLGLGTPTKVAVQFTGGSKGTIRPRPKSAIGMRGEGRGMFLVQQLTGGGAL
ncbi:hypothetical protein EDB87DRAFT_1599936 [Lactarius vividus]|nr:hypothetical protein EDB87DRAFT_1599936 [Lactarius vividus]